MESGRKFELEINKNCHFVQFFAVFRDSPVLLRFCTTTAGPSVFRKVFRVKKGAVSPDEAEEEESEEAVICGCGDVEMWR